MNTSKKFLLLIGFLFLLIAILSVSALAEKPVPPPDPDPIPATHEIVYTESTPSGVNLMLVDASGTNKTILLQGDDNLSYVHPRFSPDGSQVVFIGIYDGISGVFTIDVNTTEVTQIAFNCHNPNYPTYATVPIDWKLMVLYSDYGVGDNRDLFMVAADGSTEEPVNITKTADIWEYRPSMSYDGSFIIARGFDIDNANIYQRIYMFDFDIAEKEATNPTPISDGTVFDDVGVQDLAIAKGLGDNRLAIVTHRNLYVWDFLNEADPVQLTFGEMTYSASFLPDGLGFVVSTVNSPHPNYIYIVGEDGEFFPDAVTTASKRSFIAYPDYREIPGNGGNCTSDMDCDDGQFCNGYEVCIGGSCQSGSDPCPDQSCDEGIDQCIDDCAGNKAQCTYNEDCCSGTCINGTCRGN